MPYIMNVVRKQEKGSLDISFDLICNPYNISFLIPSQQAVFASSHLLDVFIHFFLMGIMSWLSLRDILNDFFISQKDFFCVCACVTYWKMKGKCQVEWKEKESQNELLLILWCCLFKESLSFELLKRLWMV